MDQFSAARKETIRYHQEFYASTPLGSASSWLARPHPAVIDAINLVDGPGPAQAFDLGAGVGRHTLPMTQLLPTGSTITAVDMLPTAIELLIANCRIAKVSANVIPVVADLEHFDFGDAQASLIVGFSAVEHVSSLTVMRALLERCRDATRADGIVSFGIMADRAEIANDGTVTAGLVESDLTAGQARKCLGAVFADWEIIRDETQTTVTVEQRDGAEYELRGSLVIFTARKK